MFTRQHYRMIAESISKIDNKFTRADEAYRNVELFRNDNPRFDADRFLDACGVIPGVHNAPANQ